MRYCLIAVCGCLGVLQKAIGIKAQFRTEPVTTACTVASAYQKNIFRLIVDIKIKFGKAPVIKRMRHDCLTVKAPLMKNTVAQPDFKIMHIFTDKLKNAFFKSKAVFQG